MRAVARLALLLVVGCAPPTGADTSSSAASTSAPVTTEATTSVPASTTRLGLGCPQEAGFVDFGRVLRVDQPATDSSKLGLISWVTDSGCERLTVKFETAEGAPATTPPTVVIDFLESRQVLRVWADLDSTVITDQLLETALIDRLFVVRDLAEGMFLDLHLRGPVRARADVTNSPARLIVEIEAGDQPFDSTAVFAGNTVVITPDNGSQVAAGTLVDVTGYARTFEANVLVRATIGDEVVAEATTTASDWTETWGEFRTSIQLPPGQVSLLVGEESPADGILIGATINLTVR